MNEPIPHNPIPSQMLPHDPNLQDVPKPEEVKADLEFPVIVLERQTYGLLPLLPMIERVKLPAWLEDYIKYYVDLFFQFYSKCLLMNLVEVINDGTPNAFAG